MTMSNGPGVEGNGATNALATIPNMLSLVRGLLGPVVLTLILSEASWGLWTALALMIIAEATDYIDGEIARRYDQESEIGRLADPVCDSVYHLSVFLAFLAMGWMAAWMLFVIYARDLMVPYSARLCTPVRARFEGPRLRKDQNRCSRGGSSRHRRHCARSSRQRYPHRRARTDRSPDCGDRRLRLFAC